MSVFAAEPRRRRTGIYLLPNLFTTAGFFAGFFAVIAAINGRFEAAAIAIFVAMLMDGIDGRLARLLNAQSDFGAQYDSLADMMSFGLAPALVAYLYALQELGKVWWLPAFVYGVCAALRLARFNTQVGSADKRYFQGLASPAAAALVAGLVWVGVDLDWARSWTGPVFASLCIIAGLLMVSNFRYPSFKEVDWRGRVPFMTVLVLMLVLVLIASFTSVVLFSGFAIYALWGPVFTVWSKRKARASRQAEQRPAP